MKQGIRSLVVVAVIAALSGCTRVPDLEKTSKNEVSPEKISYFKDPRTDICFASVASRTTNTFLVVSIATVPCEKVEKLLN